MFGLAIGLFLNMSLEKNNLPIASATPARAWQMIVISATTDPAAFQQWLARSGGAKGVGSTVSDLDHFPTPGEGPEFFVDYGETGPYIAEVGDGECAAT